MCEFRFLICFWVCLLDLSVYVFIFDLFCLFSSVVFVSRSVFGCVLDLFMCVLCVLIRFACLLL